MSDAKRGEDRGKSAAPVLALEAVTGGYGGAEIIHDVTIGVGPGEIVVLVGPNGAGKSTAMNAVVGLLELTGGRATLRGRGVTATATALALNGAVAAARRPRPHGEDDVARATRSPCRVAHTYLRRAG